MHRLLPGIGTAACGCLLLAACSRVAIDAGRGRNPSPKLPRIAELAGKLEGAAYRFGGSEIDGFDCSGFVAYVYSCFGIELPRRAEEQAELEKKIGLEDARQGDILVFKLDSGWHSAILLGRGVFIHAPKDGDRVRREQLNPYWLSRLRHVIAIL